MNKKAIAISLVTAFLSVSSLSVFAAEGVSREKEAEIRKTLQLMGGQKVMEQTMSQMITTMRSQLKEVPDEFWSRFQKKIKVNELIDKIIPIYDKYYSLEDLKALNAFYSSEVGQRVVAALPKITRESMAVGMEWGKRIGEEAVKEAREELKNKDAK